MRRCLLTLIASAICFLFISDFSNAQNSDNDTSNNEPSDPKTANPDAIAAWNVSLSGTGEWKCLTDVHVSVPNVPVSNLGFGNFSGDQRTDVFYGDGRNWYVFTQEGNVFRKKILNANERYQAKDLRFGEFFQKDRTDVFRADGRYWWVSKGGSGPWLRLNTSGYSSNQLTFADVTGDGLTDVLSLREGREWWVSESGKAHWRRWWRTPYVMSMNRVWFADYNGDSRADIIETSQRFDCSRCRGQPNCLCVGRGTVSVMQTGTGAMREIRREEAGTGKIYGSPYTDPKKDLGFADLTGDGKADALLTMNGTWYSANNVTGAWGGRRTSNYTANNLAFGHFNNDKGVDVFVTGSRCFGPPL